MKTKTLKQGTTNFTYSFLIKVLFVLLVTSCDSFTDVDLPKSQLTKTAVFDNYATANAALADIYIRMRDNSLLSGTTTGLSNLLAHYGDELTSYASGSNSVLPFYNNTLLASNTVVAENWNSSYNLIYAANAVLEGTNTSTKLTAAEKKTLIGEALFIRGLVHFYLTNLFGDVPYVTAIDYKTNTTIKKVTVAEIYSLIIKDLETAADLLDTSYKNTERVRPNQFVVKALLARVYLYNHAWAEASNAASAVLNATALFNLESNLSTVFLKNSKETIWQFQPSVPGKNTDEAAIFIFTTAPPPLSAITNNLISSFTADDGRKTAWTGSVKSGTNIWYYPYKYKAITNTAVSVEYSKVFRLAEQYLIRAEARAQAGDLIGAKEDLNRIRKRAGLANTVAISKEEILLAVLQERRWELFTEYGHRFFDLKRTGTIDTVLTPSKPGWNTDDALFPLPQNELSANPNLNPQNKGY